MTTWTGRTQPTTQWSARVDVETDRGERTRPITHMTPLEDAYVTVHDEDNDIIYILANSWKVIPATFWKTRPVLDN